MNKSKTQRAALVLGLCLLFVQAASAQLPDPWMGQDVGAVDIAGSASEQDGVFTITGSGNIWQPDAFYYVYQAVQGDFEIVARLDSLENVNEWSKAGLMVRQGLTDSAKTVMIFSSPNYGVHMQARITEGTESIWLGGPGGASHPRWMKLEKSGSTVTGYVSEDGNEWIKANGTDINLEGELQVGMAVASTLPGAAATALFSNVNVILSAEPLPEPWMAVDMGDDIVSSSSYDNGAFTITSNGNIWQPDRGHFVYQEVSYENFEIVANLTRLDSVNEWSKAGLMVRSALHDTAKTVYIWGSPAYNIHMQSRAEEANIESTWLGGSVWGPFVAPKWLKLEKIGNTFTGYFSEDGTTWNMVNTVDIDFDALKYVGMAVASTAGGDTTVTAVFEDVSLSEITILPEPWVATDVGAVDIAGSTAESAGVFTITGSGNIWNPDAFHFVYQPLEGDFEIVAHLDSLEHVNEWSKAGLMIRQNLEEKSKNVLIFSSPDHGINMQARLEDGGEPVWLQGPGGSPHPIWLKIDKIGNVVTGYVSADGSEWTVANSTTIALEGEVLVGMAVASTVVGQTATAIFSEITVQSPPTDVENNTAATPTAFALRQNYPNPFNPQTTIQFDLPRDSAIRIDIMDVLGRTVRTFAQQRMSAGRHQFVWDARDDTGRLVSAGVYIYRFTAGDYSDVRKMVLVK